MTAAPSRTGASSERMAALLEGLQLSEFQKEVLRQRWLGQARWMSDQSKRARRRHQLIRLPVVVGGVAIPTLITILLGAGPNDTIEWLGNVDAGAMRVIAFVVSASVALFAALEEMFRYGDRWRHYRRTAELLKTIGWQYLTLGGPFRRFKTHADAFVSFSERVEDILNEDVEGYLGTLATTESRESSRHEIIA